MECPGSWYLQWARPKPALSVLTWVKGMSLVTVAIGEMIILYFINQLILRPLGQATDSFGVSRCLDELDHARYQFSLLELC